MDNLSAHKTKKVTMYLHENFEKVFFNVVRCPKFNPIEGLKYI